MISHLCSTDTLNISGILMKGGDIALLLRNLFGGFLQTFWHGGGC